MTATSELRIADCELRILEPRAELRDCGDAELRDCGDAELRDCENAELRDCEDAELRVLVVFDLVSVFDLDACFFAMLLISIRLFNPGYLRNACPCEIRNSALPQFRPSAIPPFLYSPWSSEKPRSPSKV